MQTKKGLPAAQKKQEGETLRKLWLEHQARLKNRGIVETQEGFAGRIGINQGLLQQYFRGVTAIPLETLMDLAIELNFDPRVIRPDVERVQSKINRAIHGPDMTMLDDRLQNLPRDARKAALEYLEFLLSRNQE